MTDRGMLFSAPMVRALLNGTKTQTRRLLDPQPFDDGYYDGVIDLVPVQCADGEIVWRFNAAAVGGGSIREQVIETRFQPGDRLWVREAWHAESWYDRHAAKDRPDVIARLGEPKVWYPAGYPSRNGLRGICALDLDAQWSKGRLRPGIHMPRWASRLTLLVADVRVERLNDCSEADALAEGIIPVMEGYALDKAGRCWGNSAAAAYALLWDSINGDGAWDANPWVVATRFSVVAHNIDNLPQVPA